MTLIGAQLGTRLGAWGRRLRRVLKNGDLRPRLARTSGAHRARAGGRLWELDPFFYLAAAGLLFCLLLGGGTRGGHLSDAMLQLLTLPLLLAALWRVTDASRRRALAWPLAACAAILALPLLQLMPLPPALWTRLPGRETILTTFELLGRPPAWAPISLAPQSTWLSLLALLPPLAVFLAVTTLPWRERRLLSLVMIAFAVTSAFLGLTQLLEGPTSALRFYAVTNASAPVGFFANVNHFAALLYCALLLVAAWLANALEERRYFAKRTRDGARALVPAAVAGFALLVLICVVVVARSRAGLVLALVALIAAPTLTAPPLRELKNLASLRLVIAVIALSLLFLGRSALLEALERFVGADPLRGRAVMAQVTTEAAAAFAPVGAGVGAFVPAYAMFEQPEDVMGAYANHAHNDFLELWLETGVAGPLLLLGFLYWLARQAARAWRPSNPGPMAIDRGLIRAAVVIIALLLGHSLVDYPLRTDALMAVMAFACALLIDPPLAPGDADAPPKAAEGASLSAASTRRESGSRRSSGKNHRQARAS